MLPVTLKTEYSEEEEVRVIPYNSLKLLAIIILPPCIVMVFPPTLSVCVSHKEPPCRLTEPPAPFKSVMLAVILQKLFVTAVLEVLKVPVATI